MMTLLGQVVAAVLVAAALPLSSSGAGPASAAGQAESRGYRLRGYRWDQVLGQRWAVFEDVAHPERPLVSELDPDVVARPAQALPAVPAVQAAVPFKAAVLVVHSGDAVTLWRDEGNVKMQLAAVAEGNGAVGARVQLRVTGAGIQGNSGWRAAGMVRGPGSVEME